MDNVEKLNKIKNLIYEAEGLLELAQQRIDRLHDLLPLIRERVGEVNRRLDDFGEPETVAEPEPEVAAGRPTMPEPEVIAEPEPEVTPEPVSKPQADTKPQASGKPLFCLNDRFKFRRMIFGGSDADFNAAMDYLATIESYEEAEDYFYNDLGLDPANEEVVEFMEVIKTYFGS